MGRTLVTILALALLTAPLCCKRDPQSKVSEPEPFDCTREVYREPGRSGGTSWLGNESTYIVDINKGLEKEPIIRPVNPHATGIQALEPSRLILDHNYCLDTLPGKLYIETKTKEDNVKYRSTLTLALTDSIERYHGYNWESKSGMAEPILGNAADMTWELKDWKRYNEKEMLVPIRTNDPPVVMTASVDTRIFKEDSTIQNKQFFSWRADQDSNVFSYCDGVCNFEIDPSWGTRLGKFREDLPTTYAGLGGYLGDRPYKTTRGTHVAFPIKAGVVIKTYSDPSTFSCSQYISP
ncbi:MAG: hypothetical protein JSW08_02425 [archaeon]|nr:MAG: hypothetical protein JSW08_02425 [archaeon]